METVSHKDLQGLLNKLQERQEWVEKRPHIFEDVPPDYLASAVYTFCMDEIKGLMNRDQES